MQNGIQAVIDFGAQGRYGITKPGPGGNSRSKVWHARVERNGLEIGLRSVNEVIRWDSDDDGLPFHALSELALLKDLASCQLQPCPFVQASAVLVQPGRMYVAYSRHFSHDLITRLMIKKDPCALSIVEARSYCAQMFAGIHCMHSRGILHRNLKPAHILFDQQGFLAISGFASACREHVGQGPRDTYKLGVAAIVAPPERLLGEHHCDRSADIWAAGFIVAFMGKLGHLPFDSKGGEIGLIFGIFERLGTPQSPHPLTLLPEFSHNFPQWSYKGWDDTKPILGAEGADFVAGLTNLDPGLRMSAEAALLHTFLEDRPGSYDPKLPAPTCPVRPASTVVAEAKAAVASSLQIATHFYSGLDFQLERAFQIRRLVVARAIRTFVRHGGHSDVCELIWSFIFQPRQPEVMNLMKLRASGPNGAPPGPNELSSPVKARCLLMDWMTAITSVLKLEPQVLFLSARLVDHSVMSDGVKLSGISEYRVLFVAALLVAVKMERQEPAGSLGFLSHIVQGKSETIEKAALKLEAEMISSPAMVSGWGPYQFLCSFAERIPLSKVNFAFAHYFLDRSVLAFSLSRHTPSLLAAAACWLSISTDQQQDQLKQPGSVSACCGRSEASVARVAEELREAADCSNFPECKAASEKHAATIRLLQQRETPGV